MRVPLLLILLFGYFLSLAPATAQTVDAKKFGAEARFLTATQVLRHRLDTGDVPPAFTLTKGGATAFVWDDQDTYVAHGTEVWKYDASFANGALLFTTAYPVHGLHLDGNLLIAVSSTENDLYGRVRIADRQSGATLSARSVYNGGIFGSSLAAGRNLLVGHEKGVSPSSFNTWHYSDAGVLDNYPEHSYASGIAAWTRLDPAENRLVSSRGRVVDLGSLFQLGDIGDELTTTDVQFHGDTAIVVTYSAVTAYPLSLRESGRRVNTSAASRVFVHGDRVWLYPAAFTPSLPLSQRALDAVVDLGAPPLGERLNPQGLRFTPEKIEQDRDGNLLLMDREASAVYRWSPATRSWLATIALASVPQDFAYWPAQHAILVHYGNSTQIKRINLSGPPLETLAASDPDIQGLGLVVGDYFLTRGPVDVSCWSEQGVKTGKLGSAYVSLLAWDPLGGNVYYSGSYQVAREHLNPDGTFTGGWAQSGKHPYPGGALWLRPDSAEYLTTNGNVGTTQDFGHIANIAYAVTDAAWIGQRLYTIRELGGNTELQEWEGPQRKRGSLSRILAGKPLGLDAHDGTLCVTTEIDSAPRFSLLQPDGSPIYESPRHPLPPANVKMTVLSTTSLRLSWEHAGTDLSGFEIVRLDEWGNPVSSTTVSAATRSLDFTGLPVGSGFSCRLIARGAEHYGSAPVAASASTLVNPAQPIPGDYGFHVIKGTSTTLTFGWTDRSTNETGFRIYYEREFSGGGTVIVPPNTTTWTVPNLASDSTHRFRIEAFNGSINALASPTLTVRTPSPYQIYSSGYPKAVSVTTGQVVLNWVDELFNEDGFIIRRKVSGQSGPAVEIGRTATNFTTFTDSTVEPGLTYEYYLIAWNSQGESRTTSWTTAAVPRIGGVFLSLAARVPGLSCFAFSGPDRIERYDTAAKQWLPPLPLSAPATALHASGTDIFVATGREMLKSTNGGPLLPFANSEGVVISLAAVGDHLLFRGTDQLNSSFFSLDRQTGICTKRWELGLYDGDLKGLAVDPTRPRLYYFVMSTFGYVDIDSAGGSTDGMLSSYYIDGTKSWPSPDGTVAITSAGTVTRPDPLYLREVASLSGAVLDLDFRGGHAPVASRGTRLLVYSPDFVEVASHELGATAPAIAVTGAIAHAFIPDTLSPHGFILKRIALGDSGVNDAPVWLENPPDLDAGPAAAAVSLNLAPFVVDPDAGDTLVWRIAEISNPALFSSISINPVSGLLQATPRPEAGGTAIVAVEAVDASGAATRQEIIITVPAPPLPSAGGFTMSSDPATRIFRQTVTLTQPIGRPSGGFEILISDLPADVIFRNPSLLQPGGGIVEYHSPLPAGTQVTLLLEFYRESGAAFPSPTVTVVAGEIESGPRLFALEDPRAIPGQGLSFAFPSQPGRSYRISASAGSLSSWAPAEERLKAAGTRLFWQDRSGIPAAGRKFYRAEELAD